MNHTEVDMLIVGASCGVVAGSWLGYQLRKIAERVRDQRLLGDYKPWREQQAKRELVVSQFKPQSAREVMREKRQVIPIVREPSPEFKRETLSQETSISDRDEVIAALYGAGFNKKTATAAVDECSLPERASGIEAWTRAALAHAFKAK